MIELWQRVVLVAAGPPGAELHASRFSTILPVEPWQRIESIAAGEPWQRIMMVSFAEQWQVRRLP